MGKKYNKKLFFLFQYLRNVKLWEAGDKKEKNESGTQKKMKKNYVSGKAENHYFLLMKEYQ